MSQYWWRSQTSKLICIEVIHVKPLFVMTYIYIHIHVNQHRLSKYNPYYHRNHNLNDSLPVSKNGHVVEFHKKNNQGTGSVPSTCHTGFKVETEILPPKICHGWLMLQHPKKWPNLSSLKGIQCFKDKKSSSKQHFFQKCGCYIVFWGFVMLQKSWCFSNLKVVWISSL